MLSLISYSHMLESLISIENEYQTSGVIAMAFIVPDKWGGCCGVSQYQTSGVAAVAFLVPDKLGGCCGVPSTRQLGWLPWHSEYQTNWVAVVVFLEPDKWGGCRGIPEMWFRSL